MHTLLWMLWLASPFWEAKAPKEWTEAELQKLVEDSPWAQIAMPLRGNAPGVQVYLATATPMRQAEAEFLRRARAAPDILREEYELFLKEDGRKSVVVAVYVPDPEALSEGEEVRRMERESVMRVGRRKVAMTGHFPPTASDPYLRLVFPRDVPADAQALVFELYVPGIPAPYRQAEFRLKDVIYQGRPDF